MKIIPAFVFLGELRTPQFAFEIVWPLFFYYYYSFVLLETGDSRPILRRLDRVIGLPEETALMLRDYEYTLFRHTSVDQLLKGLAKVLSRPQHPSDKEKKHIQDVCHFQKIVSHFYLVRKKYMYLVKVENIFKGVEKNSCIN